MDSTGGRRWRSARMIGRSLDPDDTAFERSRMNTFVAVQRDVHAMKAERAPSQARLAPCSRTNRSLRPVMPSRVLRCRQVTPGAGAAGARWQHRRLVIQARHGPHAEPAHDWRHARKRAKPFGQALDSHGAEGGTRTHTLLRAADFESAASTDSATSAWPRSIASCQRNEQCQELPDEFICKQRQQRGAQPGPIYSPATVKE